MAVLRAIIMQTRAVTFSKGAGPNAQHFSFPAPLLVCPSPGEMGLGRKHEVKTKGAPGVRLEGPIRGEANPFHKRLVIVETGPKGQG